MSNGLKFRQPPQQTKTSNQKFGNRGLFDTQFGPLFDSKEESEEEHGEKRGHQKRKVVKTEGKAKKHKRSGESKTKLRGGQAPPGRGHRRVGGGRQDEFDRVAAMLESIRKTLERLVIVTPRVVPQELHPSIRQSWHQAEEGFKTAIATLQDKTQRVELNPKLEAAGFTGEMLDMKETSLNYHMAGVDKAILSYNNNDTMLEKFVRWIKPGFKVMNSVLGSLSTIPGVEVGKEFKEHLESAYEVVETGQAE
jgi:hypothetical protein